MNMKMSKDDYAELKTTIDTYLAAKRSVLAEHAKYLTDLERYRVTDAQDTPQGDINQRWRWDIFHAAMRWNCTRIGESPNDFILDQYAKGLDDTHIDTALRRCVPPITEYL